jgi:signal transduction histidine kinase/DNA-binding NarL/FixJ family response regulator
MRVLLADDSEAIRYRVKEILSEMPGVEIAGEAYDTFSTRMMAHELKPDVMVVDLRMPGGGGIMALQQIQLDGNPPTTIVLTNYPTPEYRRTCMALGADFFLDKSTEFEKLPQILRDISATGNVPESSRQVAMAQAAELSEKARTLAVMDDVMRRAKNTEEERFQELFNHIHNGVVAYRPTADGQDFTITALNPAAKEAYALKDKDVVGQPLMKAFPGIKACGLFDVIKRVADTGTPEIWPAVLYDDGRVRMWTETEIYQLSSGDIIAVFDDITDRYEMQEELESSERRLRRIIECNADGILIIDDKGVVLFANPASVELFERDWRELQGEVIGGVVPEEGTSEIHIRQASGRVRTLETRSTRIEWKRSVAFLVSLRDITDRISVQQALTRSNTKLEKALEELTRTQEQAIQSERMNALGQMVSGIVHDFNNVLMPILGLSELLAKDPDAMANREESQELLDTICSAAGDAKEIVRRLRAFYRPDEDLDVSTISVPALFDRVINTTRPAWETQAQAKGKRVAVTLDTASLPTLHANESRIREVLTNLVLNAVHAMPDGGSLTLAARKEEGCATLIIEDSGEGMSDEVRRRCLEPFYTTKGEEGSGLGLAMCHGIMASHGGAVDIDSAPGCGTRIYLRFPLSAEAWDEDADGRNIEEPGDQAATLHILVIDDHELSLSLIKRCLERLNHSVTACNSGEEALACLADETFDVVITDKVMPGMPGDEVARAVKAANPNVPVIMLTGFGEGAAESEEMDGVVDSVLGKPVTLKDIRVAIARVTGDA